MLETVNVRKARLVDAILAHSLVAAEVRAGGEARFCPTCEALFFWRPSRVNHVPWHTRCRDRFGSYAPDPEIMAAPLAALEAIAAHNGIAL